MTYNTVVCWHELDHVKTNTLLVTQCSCSILCGAANWSVVCFSCKFDALVLTTVWWDAHCERIVVRQFVSGALRPGLACTRLLVTSHRPSAWNCQTISSCLATLIPPSRSGTSLTDSVCEHSKVCHCFDAVIFYAELVNLNFAYHLNLLLGFCWQKYEQLFLLYTICVIS